MCSVGNESSPRGTVQNGTSRVPPDALLLRFGSKSYMVRSARGRQEHLKLNDHGRQ